MEVGQGQNWGCSAKKKMDLKLFGIHSEGMFQKGLSETTRKLTHDNLLPG
jgi:hypothetical protein